MTTTSSCLGQKFLNFLEDGISELGVSSRESHELLLRDPVRCKSVRVLRLLEARCHGKDVFGGRHLCWTRADATHCDSEPLVVCGPDVGERRFVFEELRVH